jgi:hypothetical protein
VHAEDVIQCKRARPVTVVYSFISPLALPSSRLLAFYSFFFHACFQRHTTLLQPTRSNVMSLYGGDNVHFQK